uniref:Uncharacterized protein MANES_15G095600 n=1 Tax=Rhizophora mucronata TaxID=61149 RepID=A0A2P2LXN9_RHIMU
MRMYYLLNLILSTKNARLMVIQAHFGILQGLFTSSSLFSE